MIQNLILSTIAFFAAIFFLNRYLEAKGMRKSLSRKILVFSMAYAISVVVSVVVDKATTAIYGEDASAMKSLTDASEMLKKLQEASGR